MSDKNTEHRFVGRLETAGEVCFFVMADALFDGFSAKVWICGAFLVAANLWIWFKFYRRRRKWRVTRMALATVLLLSFFAIRLSYYYDKEHPAPQKYQTATVVDQKRSEQRIHSAIEKLNKDLGGKVDKIPKDRLIDPKDITLFVDGKPLTASGEYSTSVDISSSAISRLVLDFHNDSDGIPIFNPALEIDVKGCEITSKDLNWVGMAHRSDGVGSLMWRTPNPDIGVNSGTPFDFPPVNLECKEEMSHRPGYLKFSARGMNPVHRHFFIEITPH
jgi:hypothetical protein